MPFSKSKIFLLSCLSFIVGVGIGSFFKISLFYIFIASIIFILTLIFSWSKPKVRYLLLFVLCLILGLARYQLAIHQNSKQEISYYNDRGEISFQGEIVSVDSRSSSQQLIVETRELLAGERGQKTKGKVLIKTGLYPEYRLGQTIEARGQLKTPAKIEDFAYDRYLSRYDIYSVCYQPEINLVNEKSHSFRSWLNAWQLKLKRVTDQSLVEPAASLFNGMVLNVRGDITTETLNNFSRTGIIHVISISGAHISIISAMLMSLFIGLGLNRKKAFWWLVLFLIFYVILVGAPVAAVRAAGMGLLVLLAMRLGRLGNSINALVLLAFISLLINPKLLRDDIGFQLSYGAVLGLIYGGPFFEKYFAKLPSLFGAKEGLLMTLSAQIFTLPLVAYHFDNISLTAPLVNILIAPVLSLILMLGLPALVIGLFFSLLAKIIFWPVWLMLAYIFKVAEIFARIPGGCFEVGKEGLGVFLVGYGLVVGAVWFFFRKSESNFKHQTLNPNI